MLNRTVEFLNSFYSHRLMVLDGAMGSLLISKNLKEIDFCNNDLDNEKNISQVNNFDILNLTRPDLIQSIHYDYLNAGADIITTNTFNANGASQKKFATQDKVYEINCQAAKIARNVASQFNNSSYIKPRFVAGAIGPSDSRFTSQHKTDTKSMYLPQIYGLIEGGVDFLLIESVLFIEDCIDIINDINESDKKLKTKTPLIVSATIDENGDLYSGETIEQFNDKISNLPNVISIGLNCSLGAEKIFNHAVKLSNISSIPLTIYPSIGLPDSKGDYAMPAEKFAIHMNNLIQNTNCKIAGGCCGTTPEYINLISNLSTQT